MRKSNILQAIINISKSNDTTLSNYKGFDDPDNRIQRQGQGLEIFIKDSFCGIPSGMTCNETRIENYLQVFSDTGHSNSPPDAMIKESDAMEIKKHEGFSTKYIALNTSPPRTVLTDEDRNIVQETKDCEPKPWTHDYLYIIGNSESEKLRRITLCYGDCFVSSDKIYRDFFDKIKKSISEGDIGNAEFLDSKEFGRICKIDPQDFTTLRIRSMFELQNPNEVFKEEINWRESENLTISAIMRKEKFLSFPEEDRESLKKDNFEIKEFKGKNPNEPKKDIDLVLIRKSK